MSLEPYRNQRLTFPSNQNNKSINTENIGNPASDLLKHQQFCKTGMWSTTEFKDNKRKEGYSMLHFGSSNQVQNLIHYRLKKIHICSDIAESNTETCEVLNRQAKVHSVWVIVYWSIGQPITSTRTKQPQIIGVACQKRIRNMMIITVSSLFQGALSGTWIPPCLEFASSQEIQKSSCDMEKGWSIVRSQCDKSSMARTLVSVK